MRRRHLLLLLIIALVPVVGIDAQAHLSVDLKDPVYNILEAAELRGALSTLSAVRPYSRTQVIELLDRVWEARDRLSEGERAVLKATRQRFAEKREGLRHGNIASMPDQQGAGGVAVGADVQANSRLNVNSAGDWHLDSVMRPYLRGDLTDWLSYVGILGFTFDRVRAGEAFPPYGFTKEWDAFHLSFSEPRYSDGELDYPTFSYHLETEIAADLLGNDVRLGFARLRREWGIGDGSLTLGGSARPFMGAEVHYQLAPWVIGHYLVGSLSNWQEELWGSGSIISQKLFALQRMEFIPSRWLYLSASSTIIGAQRFELTYLSPLLFGVMAQNLIGDLDNVGVGVDVGFTVAPFGRAYISFYADEMEITNLSELFTRPRNMFALQGGFKLPVPWQPFTTLTLQYTRIEPFTYTHYPTDYPGYDIPVDSSYTHDGENLAYHLWPNSDEILVKFRSLPFPNLAAGLEYRLIRHGDNPPDFVGELTIRGRPDEWLDYSNIDLYPDKDFLHDGLYDINNIVTVSGEYTVPDWPVTVGLSYTFSHTFWLTNASGEPCPGDIVRNIVGLSVKVFR